MNGPVRSDCWTAIATCGCHAPQERRRVPTTVWFALLDDKAYVFTGLNLAKAKRIRNNPHVTLTASNFRGKPIVQSSIEAEARLMGKDEEELPNRIIDQQYGWQYRLFIGFLGSPRNLPSTSSSS